MNAVALIPPGVDLTAAAAVMKALAGCYPADNLQLTNDSNGGLLIIHDPTRPPAEPAEPTMRMSAGLSVEEAVTVAVHAQPEDGLLALSSMMMGMLDEHQAANYLAWSVRHEPTDSWFELRIQRAAGLTPADKLLAAIEQALCDGADEQTDVHATHGDLAARLTVAVIALDPARWT